MRQNLGIKIGMQIADHGGRLGACNVTRLHLGLHHE